MAIVAVLLARRLVLKTVSSSCSWQEVSRCRPCPPFSPRFLCRMPHDNFVFGSCAMFKVTSTAFGVKIGLLSSNFHLFLVLSRCHNSRLRPALFVLLPPPFAPALLYSFLSFLLSLFRSMLPSLVPFSLSPRFQSIHSCPLLFDSFFPLPLVTCTGPLYCFIVSFLSPLFLASLTSFLR